MTPTSLDAMAASVPDGALVALPPDNSLPSVALARALVRRGAKGLRLLGVPVSGFATDLLIGAGALMTQANGLDFERHGHLREAMVELITITEGFFACGVAASVYPVAAATTAPAQSPRDRAGSISCAATSSSSRSVIRESSGNEYA